MNKCLLCQNDTNQGQSFSELLFFIPKSPTLCDNCRKEFQSIPEEHCPCCFKPDTKQVCDDCIYWQGRGFSVEHHSLFRYNEAMATYFSRYKFQGDYLLRYTFSKDIKQTMRYWRDYTIVPIPISQQRMEERGFNQVTGLLEAAGVTYKSFLEKEDGQRQSEKTRAERLHSQQTFLLREIQKLPEKILLVDDIYTTGSTLIQAKTLLMKNGAKKIKTFSLAR